MCNALPKTGPPRPLWHFFVSPLCPLLKAADVRCLAFICTHAEAPWSSPCPSQTQRSLPDPTPCNPGLVANSQQKCSAYIIPQSLRAIQAISKSRITCTAVKLDLDEIISWKIDSRQKNATWHEPESFNLTTLLVLKRNFFCNEHEAGLQRMRVWSGQKEQQVTNTASS